MKFRKSIPREVRQLLERDLNRYETEFSMSNSEYAELRQWVQEGHSPYDNPWYIATEGGIPMDYINAKQVIEHSEELVAAYDTVNDEPVFIVQDVGDDAANEELPF